MIRLHHCHQARSQRVLWMLYELGLDFELVLHPFGPELRDPTYLALHPAGRVPALEIDGGVIFESLGALEYLSARHPEAGLGGSGIDWLNWLNFAETISQHAAALTQQHVVIYDGAMRSDTVMKLEPLRLAKVFGAIEARLDGRDYLLDSGFSAADVGVVQALYMARHFARIEPFGRLSEYYARVTTRPAFVRTLPPDNAVRLYKQDFYEGPNG